VATLSVLLAAPSAAQGTVKPCGVVDDWSIRRLVFSNPGTVADAMRKGTVENAHTTERTPSRPQNRLVRAPFVSAFSHTMRLKPAPVGDLG
jgi:hypothetical protein